MASRDLDRILKVLEGAPGLPVFRYTDDLEKEHSIEWGGDDPTEFVELARTLGDGTIYISVGRVDEDEEREGWKDHRGQIALLEGAYLRSGIWHFKGWTSDWLRDMPRAESDSDIEPTEDGVPLHRIGVIEMTPETRKFIERFKKEGLGLVDAYIADAERSHPPPDPMGWGLRESVLKFYRRKLGDSMGYFNQSWIDGDENAREVWEQVSSVAEKALLAREQAKVLELVPQCVEWAQKQGLTQLLQSDVEVFEADHGRTLSSWGRKELWRRAKLGLKARG